MNELKEIISHHFANSWTTGQTVACHLDAEDIGIFRFCLPTRISLSNSGCPRCYDLPSFESFCLFEDIEAKCEFMRWCPDRYPETLTKLRLTGDCNRVCCVTLSVSTRLDQDHRTMVVIKPISEVPQTLATRKTILIHKGGPLFWLLLWWYLSANIWGFAHFQTFVHRFNFLSELLCDQWDSRRKTTILPHRLVVLAKSCSVLSKPQSLRIEVHKR